MTLTSEDQINQAVQFLKLGQLVAFPTETVYGLGADASSPVALSLLYKVKGRPSSHPVIVHLASQSQLADWAIDIPDEAYSLAKTFWPGPLTMILHRHPHVLDQVTGGQDTIAIRIPNHPIALALLKRFDGGIAAPSANKFGKLSPTTAQAVMADLGTEVSLVLDGGPCTVGIESTIVDLTCVPPKILRPGMLLASDLNSALSLAITTDVKPTSKEIRVPGLLDKHYAPMTPLKLVTSNNLISEISNYNNQPVSVLAFGKPANTDLENSWVTAPIDPTAYAHDLYANLRQLDKYGSKVILVEMPPPQEDWLPILDRLQRAAGLKLER